MENKKTHEEARFSYQQDPDCGDRRYDDRRYDDRRKAPREGFTYVSTVGWICRREQRRRKDDPFDIDF